MTPPHDGSDQIGHGEASLGDAQSSNPPDDPDMLEPDAGELDTDTDYEGDDPAEVEVTDGPDDPAPAAP